MFGLRKSAPPPSRRTNPWELSFPLIGLTPRDSFTLGNAFEGIHIFGGNGSGKTSGPGQALAKALLRSGAGGLVLTAKTDECALWRTYAEETGRADQLMVFSPEERWRFNFLAYEQRRPGRGTGLTENIVRLLTTVQEAGDRADGGGKQERYWKNALNQLLRNTIDLLLLSRPQEKLSVSGLHQVITSAPTSVEAIDSESWQQGSLCYQLLEEALHSESLSERQKQDLQITGKFWLTEFPQLPHETRGSIISTFTTMADTFLRGSIGELFSTGLNILPEVTHEGAVIVVDLPVKSFGQVGLFSQILMKYVWQQAAERRDTHANSRPIFLWADESHLFVNETDVSFATTARSSRACMVYLSQTLPNYYWALGGQDKGKALTDSLMGVLQTKILCANADPTTNQWSAEIFAKSWQQKFQSGINHNDKGGGGSNAGSSESLEYNIQPAQFLTLRRGGPHNHFLVETIIGQGGRVFSNGQTFIKTAFSQV